MKVCTIAAKLKLFREYIEGFLFSIKYLEKKKNLLYVGGTVLTEELNVKQVGGKCFFLIIYLILKITFYIPIPFSLSPLLPPHCPPTLPHPLLPTGKRDKSSHEELTKSGTLSCGRTKSLSCALKLSLAFHHREWVPTS